MEKVRDELMQCARQAASLAYCPYSNYAVGAALLTSTGEIITGCNVENVSYGLTNCAERTAIFAAVAKGVRDFRALAIAGGRAQAAAPCGACRQVLSEFCKPCMPVFFGTLVGGEITATTLGALLPLAFDGTQDLAQPPRK